MVLRTGNILPLPPLPQLYKPATDTTYALGMIYDVYMKYTLLHNEAADLLKPPPTLTGKGTVKTPNTNKTKQNKTKKQQQQNKTKQK